MSTCPNPDCSHLYRFDAGDLTIVEWSGKKMGIRRLDGSMSKHRFTERQGTLLRDSKLPQATVVRIVWATGPRTTGRGWTC